MILEMRQEGVGLLVHSLKEYVAFNREFWSDMQTAKKAGKTIDDTTAVWKIPAKYAGYTQPVPDRLKNNVKMAYSEIK